MNRLQAWLTNRAVVPDSNQILPIFRTLCLMPACLPGKDYRYLLNKMLGAPQSRAGFFAKKNFLFGPDTKKKFLPFSDTYPSHTRILVTVPKVLIWLLVWCRYGH